MVDGILVIAEKWKEGAGVQAWGEESTEDRIPVGTEQKLQFESGSVVGAEDDAMRLVRRTISAFQDQECKLPLGILLSGSKLPRDLFPVSFVSPLWVSPKCPGLLWAL